MTKRPPKHLELPFDILESVSPATKDSLEKAAFHVNDRYLDEFLELYAFCPYSQVGRQKGQVHRYFYYCDSPDVMRLVDIMKIIAADPEQVVAQVIMPLIDVSAYDWCLFSHALTSYGHQFMDSGEVLAVAPLHPELAFKSDTAAAMVPLFRRTPDPTIQWVRLDGLDAIYSGRGSGTAFIDIDAIEEYMTKAKKKRPPLWDKIADTNAAMARRLGIPEVEGLLAGLAKDGRQAYTDILLKDE